VRRCNLAYLNVSPSTCVCSDCAKAKAAYLGWLFQYDFDLNNVNNAQFDVQQYGGAEDRIELEIRKLLAAQDKIMVNWAAVVMARHCFGN
jgi:hypothetical protein